MSFDVLKGFRSPGCAHGHDEESRNGRDMKIDILEAYIWISEVFRVKSGFYRSTGRLPKPPRSLMGHSGPCGEEERRPGQGRAPLPPSLNRTRRGGGAPPFLPLLHLFPPSPIPTRKGGSPTPGGSRTPPGAPLLAGRTSPLTPLYTGAGGTLERQQLIV